MQARILKNYCAKEEMAMLMFGYVSRLSRCGTIKCSYSSYVHVTCHVSYICLLLSLT